MESSVPSTEFSVPSVSSFPYVPSGLGRNCTCLCGHCVEASTPPDRVHANGKAGGPVSRTKPPYRNDCASAQLVPSANRTCRA